jgi:hypothetical protein
MSSWVSSSLDSESIVGVGTVDAAKLGVGLLASCRMASRGQPSLYSKSCDGVGMTGVATLGVGLPESCPASRCSSSPASTYCVGISLPASCRMASRGSSSLYSEVSEGVGPFDVQGHKLQFSKAPAESKIYWCKCPLPPATHFAPSIQYDNNTVVMCIVLWKTDGWKQLSVHAVVSFMKLIIRLYTDRSMF